MSKFDFEEVDGNTITDTEREVDLDVDILIKAENHASRADLQEELDLLNSGAFDAVVFEAAREDVEEITSPTLTDRIVNLPFFFLDTLYTDSTPLLATISRTDTIPFYTRERDRDIIEGLPTPFPTIVITVWVIFILLTAAFGAPQGTAFRFFGYNVPYKGLSLLSFLGAFCIPITVRIFRSKFGEGVNRNQIMSSQIEAAHEEAGRTLAILGSDHAVPVKQRLSKEIESDVISASHGLFSVPGLRTFIPGILRCMLLFLAVWWIVEQIGGAIFLLIIHIFVA